MKIDIVLIATLLAVFGSYLLWAAYQIQFNNRVDLVRFGSGQLPGASLLKRQFAVLHVFNGVTCLVVAILILATGHLTPGVWVFAGVSCALAVRRGLLVRAIEMKSTEILR